MAGLAKVFLLLTTAMFVVGMAVIGIAQVSYSDPFAPYRAIMPGQPSDVLKSLPCGYAASQGNPRELNFCQFDPSYGVFAHVIVYVSKGIITRMAVYDIHPEALLLGDLILCWGKPSGIGTVVTIPLDPNARPIIFWADNNFVTLAQDNTRSNDFQSVDYISIDDPPPACGSRE